MNSRQRKQQAHIARKVRPSESRAPGENNKETPNPERDTDQKSDGAPRQTFSVSPSPANTGDTEESEQNAMPWWKRWTIWKRILETVGILAGSAYAVITYFQWKDLRYNFQVNQRAWIQMFESLPATITEDAVVDRALITLNNVGKSVANRSMVHAVFDVVEARNAPPLDFNKTHTLSDVGLLFPGASAPQIPAVLRAANGSARSLSKPELRQLLDGTAYLVVFTQVIYSDPFGKHWTRSCAWKDYSTDPKAVFLADACVAWNAVGEGEPPKQ